ncbi:restriction endonuclease [Kribbella antibiotica]|uniref:Restriction endonuclease n=1 Tax=Kribbella antibiotica TaxID=190195 RepID=A0A4R4ZL76_9ACTN|nr:restriction endonuclease [Kribbella antibiotica]TDD58836.1 restriction endonuclease [Kribbella antibiotica]
MASRGKNTDWRRAAEAQRRANERTQAQAAREFERQRKALEKEQREAYVQSRLDEADRLTAQAEHRVGELSGLLARSLKGPPPRIDFNSLLRRRTVVRLDLGDDARPAPEPGWGNYAPFPPGALSRLFGGEGRYARRQAEAERAFARDVEAHKAAEAARLGRVANLRSQQAREQGAEDAETAKHNDEIKLFAQRVRAGDRLAVSRYFKMLIERTPDPRGFPTRRLAGYVPESNLLALEWRIPGVEIIPDKKTFKYIKTRDAIESTPRPIADVRKLYQQLVAQMALRALQVVFSAAERELVTTVVFNGIVKAIDPSTGQTIKPCLITLRATRDQFEGLVLEKLDPVACIRKYFAAEVSPHPDELQAVQPVMTFDKADPRVIDAVDIISGIDKRPNLLELTPKEFEHFIQNLFNRMGFDTLLFKADGDGGVDCVAYDPTPIRGGKYVIQVKLYRKTVQPAAVRDLYGTMQHEGATTGILITTSGYGPSSYTFANGKPLQLIDATGLLALCKEFNIPARIVPTSAKPTP